MCRTSPLISIARIFFFLTHVSLLVILNLSTQTQTQTHVQDRFPVILNDEKDEYPLGFHMEILIDPTRKLTIEEVTSPEFDGKFIRNKTKDINPGFVNSAYWIRFQVNNQSHQTSEWWLEIASYEIEVSLYYPRPDGLPGFEVKKSGRTRSTSKSRKTYSASPVFSLHLATGSEQTIYLRIDGQHLNLPMTLWSGTGFMHENQKKSTFKGFYLGIFLIMAVYNFFLFWAVYDKNYLYYALFMICALFAMLLRENQTHLIFNIITFASTTLMVVFLLRFSSSFLMAETHAPRLDRILNGLQIGVGIFGLLSIVMSEVILFIQIWFLLVLFGIVVIFITGLVSWWQGYRPARYFVLAKTIFLGTFFFLILGLLGYSPIIYIDHIIAMGAALGPMLMSLALADRVKTIRKERKLAEEETSQRTRELILLNQVIAATTTAVELETILETVCRELGRTFGLTHAIAVLADEKNSTVRIAADYHTEDRSSILGQSFPVELNPLLEHINVRKAPLIVKNAQNDPRTTSIRQHFHLRNTTTLLLFPLVVEKEIIGGFILGSNRPGHFSADVLSLVQSVAEQMTGAILRIRLVEDRQQLEAQYYQTRKIDAIGSLAGGISHDFNNLLTPIIGYMEMAMTELPPGHKLYPFLERVLKAGKQASKLIKQILAFSRKQVLKIKSVDLNDIITDFNKMLSRLIGEDIDLQLFLDPSLYPVKADRSQIEQVLLNLAVNARDAMSMGGKIKVETSNVFLDEKYAENHAGVIPGSYVMLAISDNGCGMDEETRHRIFEPFFTTKEQGKGTGLGLATVHGIVKQHRGNIWVYSQPEKGTTFKIYLPRADEPVQQAESPIRIPEHTAQVGTETVLIVDDEEGVLDLVTKTLETYGYHILKAGDPEQGLKIASTHSSDIDLLLTDVIMPNMNGRELYKHLHEISPRTKVLYMSGYTDDMIVRDGILEEGTNYLQKPFSIRKLTQEVRNILDG